MDHSLAASASYREREDIARHLPLRSQCDLFSGVGFSGVPTTCMAVGFKLGKAESEKYYVR